VRSKGTSLPSILAGQSGIGSTTGRFARRGSRDGVITPNPIEEIQDGGLSAPIAMSCIRLHDPGEEVLTCLLLWACHAQDPRFGLQGRLMGFRKPCLMEPGTGSRKRRREKVLASLVLIAETDRMRGRHDSGSTTSDRPIRFRRSHFPGYKALPYGH